MNKNRFLTFLFSMVPGCGLLYLGYMKKGLQVMVMFAATVFMGGFFASYGIGWFGGLFFMFLPIIWFYQFFDAMHTVSRMKYQGIELPADDDFILPDRVLRLLPTQNRKVAKIAAGILILVGSLTLVSGVLNNLWRYPGFDQEVLHVINTAIQYNLIPAVISVLLILAGIRLLGGSRDKKTDETFSDEGEQS
ncbi:MAG: hypothetical protein FWF88_05525 [Peptococcaceae bacterium]|nr:hypothetical protein [Peptococcaceae bacterium]